MLKPEIRGRLTDSVETTLRLSSGIVTVLYETINRTTPKDGAVPLPGSTRSPAAARSKS